MDPRTAAELRRISGILREAADALARLAEPSPPPPKPAPPPKAPPVDWPWDRIVNAALLLLVQHPGRLWRQAELARAVRDTGIELPTTRGMHFGLVARLKERGAVIEDDSGALRAFTSTPAAPTAEAPPADEIQVLADEIDATERYLTDLDRRMRTAQVAAWAGQARALQDAPAADPRRRQSLTAVFGRLTRITRDLDCGWIDALSREWSADWKNYVAWFKGVAAGSWPKLPPDAEQALHRAFLRGLLNPLRRVATYEAQTTILEALEVLPPEDPDAAAAIARFGLPAEVPKPSRSRSDRETLAPEREEAPEEVRAATRGRRLLMAGGQGAREEQRQAIQKALECAELEWVTSERGQAAPFVQLESRIRPGRYDMVLFLAAYTGHKSTAFLRAVKQAEIPLVYLPRGYGVAAVVDAIRLHLRRRRERVSP